MVRTVKLPCDTSPQCAEMIAGWRKAQSVVVRTAYNRLREGMPEKDVSEPKEKSDTFSFLMRRLNLE